ncbi:MAG: hypothetical protein IT427_13435 [Pirellulales bacterium]|nr:hypothetical protein [Pirellulales bacterium]
MNSAFGLSPSTFHARQRWLLVAFTTLSLTIFGRLIALEVRNGDEYRHVGAEPMIRQQQIPAIRGRILARDGTVLATDEGTISLAVNYRWLEEPANSRWLRQTARSRLTARERSDPRRVVTEQAVVLQQRQQLARRLMSIGGIDASQWQRRVERIQLRVQAIADIVNARRAKSTELQDWRAEDFRDEQSSWVQTVVGTVAAALFKLGDPPPVVPITVIEQVSEHVVLEDLPLEVAAEIEQSPQLFPGVKLINLYRRTYPAGSLAGQTVGIVGEPEEVDRQSSDTSEPVFIGKSGIERQFEHELRARPGLIVDQLDPLGRLKASSQIRAAAAGNDVMLTIDSRVQRAAEQLLDESLRHRLPSENQQLDRSAGGAAVVLDVHSGDVLVAATAPRYDPTVFARRDSARIRNCLSDPAKPMLDRTIQMALPPGSVFKIVTAAAILDAGVNPHAAVDCLGYLHQPDALRCAIYRRTGVGHGPVNLADALARSCNVYFFHHAEQLGATNLLNWAERFGLGRRSGIHLAGEVAGNLPDLSSDTSTAVDVRPMSIGQSTITTTPLQMACVAAAIANGGRRVNPRIISQDNELITATKIAPQESVKGLSSEILGAIRSGMRQAVADEYGTAHASVDRAEIAIAGKTGTAQSGVDRPDHAWFVGYAPAENPQVAFAIALEYAGDGAIAAGPIAKQLVAELDERGYFTNRLSRRANQAIVP